MKRVVPQPGATLPYSEFKGFNALPKPVCFAISLFKKLSRFFLLSNVY
jgi:hypothetical protein